MSLLHQIALTLIQGVGDRLAKNLVSYCGGAKQVFEATPMELSKIPGIGKPTLNTILQSINNKEIFDKAAKEIDFIKRNDIQPLFYTNKDYPIRLKGCLDSPTILFYKGTLDLNTSKVISVVGTRRITEYGKEFCTKFFNDLAAHDIMVVSGMAYGVDTHAHKNALLNGLGTVGVFAHGLDMVYPAANRKMAMEMEEKGGLITEFLSETIPDRENFPKRNRVVAGMADATIVIESPYKGGSLITAEIANSYNRDVFAVPGRVGDYYSEGCNNLIRSNKGALIQSAEELLYMMNWKFRRSKYIESFIGLSAAVFFHGLYEFTLFTEDYDLLIIIAGGAILFSFLLIRKAARTKKEDLNHIDLNKLKEEHDNNHIK